MTEKKFETNVKIENLQLLSGIESLSQLCTEIIHIRKKFDFSGTVCLDMVYNLEQMQEKTGVCVPGWVVGISIGKRVVILEKSKWKDKSLDLGQLILHEFVHIALGYGIRKNIPIWINEGFAVYLSGQYKDYNLKVCSIEPEMDFYSLSYADDNLYDISVKILIMVIKRYGEKNVLREIIENSDLRHSEMLGNQTLHRIAEEETMKNTMHREERGKHEESNQRII